MRRRLSAQIDGINWATGQISDIPGDILELGCGESTRSITQIRRSGISWRRWS